MTPMWSKIFDIPAYIAVVGLLIYGALGIYRNEPLQEGENAPSFYIICALFILMFIFGNRRFRKFQERIDEDDETK